MSKYISKLKFLIIFLVGLTGSIAYPKDSLDGRMERKITLDMRDRNIVDVIKFLAQKGEFNVIIAPSVEGRSMVFLHGVDIKDALDIVVISNKLAYHIDDDIVQVMTAGEYEAMYGSPFSGKTEVSIVHLQYAKPSYVLAALDNMRGNRGKIIIDEDTGSVVLMDTPQSIALMKKAIDQIDQQLGTVEKTIRSLNVPVKEVLIEARVLRIVINPKLSLSGNLLGEAALNAAAATDHLANNFGRIMVGNFSANDFTGAKTLSTPQILVANNEQAVIHIGDTVAYMVAAADTVRFVDVGLKLSVVPTINDDGMLTMKLAPEISEVAAAIKSAEGSAIPQVNKTEGETSVMIKDGQTIVMAGLRNQHKVHTKKGIPVLMDIPFIGGVFSRTSDTLTNTEIVILITPHIVKSGDDFEKTNRFRSTR